jgi:hypothetical protein
VFCIVFCTTSSLKLPFAYFSPECRPRNSSLSVRYPFRSTIHSACRVGMQHLKCHNILLGVCSLESKLGPDRGDLHSPRRHRYFVSFSRMTSKYKLEITQSLHFLHPRSFYGRLHTSTTRLSNMAAPALRSPTFLIGLANLFAIGGSTYLLRNHHIYNLEEHEARMNELEGTLRGHIGLIEEALDRLEGNSGVKGKKT